MQTSTRPVFGKPKPQFGKPSPLPKAPKQKNPDKVRLGKRAKEKGKEFEQAVAEALAAYLGLPMTEVVRTRSGTKETDIGLSMRAAAALPFHFECKNCKTLSPEAWLKQATEDCPEGRLPVVVFKTHRGRRKIAMLDLEVFLRIATRRTEP